MSPADKTQVPPTLATMLHGHQSDDGDKELHTYAISEIVAFIKENAGAATAIADGLLSAMDKTRIDDLWEANKPDKFTALESNIFPLIIQAPINSVVDLLFNLTSNEYEVERVRIQTASGSIDVTFKIDGTPITGINGVTASATPATIVASNAADRVIGLNKNLSLTLANNSSAASLMITLQIKNRTSSEA